ncbi:hypothetical protein, partial [Xanthomonas arboricola]
FAQEADDLLFGKTLLHVQSPWGRELDSKLRCYSKLGGRRPRAEIDCRRCDYNERQLKKTIGAITPAACAQRLPTAISATQEPKLDN